MKIIDEKGRLFGKINIIDFTIIIFLLGFVPLFYFWYKISNKPLPPQHRNEWHEVTVKFSGLIPELAFLIKEGDYEIDSESKTIIAKVKDILESTPMKSVVRVNYGMYLRMDSNPFSSDVILRLGLLFKKTADGEMLYKEKPLRIGENLVFKTSNYAISGTILSTDWVGDVFKDEQISEDMTHVIEVQFENVPPEIANIVKEGDTERDISGKSSSRIEKIVANTPGSEVLLIAEDGLKFAENPRKNIMRILFTIRCHKKDGAVFFKEIQIRIGDGFEFVTDKYKIFGTIIKM